MSLEIIQRLAVELQLQPFQVNNTVRLLFQEECTVPFVARYRKEMTGSMDEVKIREVRERYLYIVDLEDTKRKYLKVIEEVCQKNPVYKGKFPELKDKVNACQSKQALEDLYLPFKPKRRTKAQAAREKGLEALLELILAQRATLNDFQALAKDFVTPADSKIDASIKVASEAEALAGAADILAERLSEQADLRGKIRNISFDSAILVSKKIETPDAKEPTVGLEPSKGRSKDKKSDASNYQNYFDYRESIHTAPSHRVMAVRRGEAEKFLRISIDVPRDSILQEMESLIIKSAPTSKFVTDWLRSIIADAYDRLLAPSIETEIRLHLKTKAEDDSMKVFTKNLEKLLLLPPIPGKVVMGVDPGIRTGSKIALVDETGKLLESTTVYPDIRPNEIVESPKTAQTKQTFLGFFKKYPVSYVAIGNGTGSREIDRIIAACIKENELKDIRKVVVNEAGASVYSTDEIAREEFPDLDATIRSAISIARRLQDPLAELVKIDPRSIGVGQYQHDVNVTKLKNGLEEVVESCVNKVGVNLNSASYKLLSYVAGIGPNLAKTIVAYRDKNGRFESRSDVQRVPGLGPKAYQQSAGFLRVPDSKYPLDNTGVHPERYEVVEDVARAQKATVGDLVGKAEVIQSIPWEKYVTESLGLPTLKDIANELQKPGRDPRVEGARIEVSEHSYELEDLKQNMILTGTVTNVTNFGAFVDIGVHQDGLIHISELSDQFVKDASQVISVGDILSVRILDVDMQKRRISLSARLTPTENQQNRQGPRPSDARSGGNKPQSRSGGNHNQRPQDRNAKPKAPEKHYSMNDLLAKFGKK